MDAVVWISLLAFIVGSVDLKAPSGMSQHQYCAGCISTVKEIEKRVSKRRMTPESREGKVMEIVESICSPNNFVEYEYSPPKTVKACKALIEEFEEDIEEAFIKDKPSREDLICTQISKACVGVDMSQSSRRGQHADIDLTSDEGDSIVSKSIKVDPASGKVEPEESKKQGKSKESDTRKQSDKGKKSKKTGEAEAKTSTKKKADKSKENAGVKKGAIHNLHVDINDPSSMERVMKEIQDIKDEL